MGRIARSLCIAVAMAVGISHGARAEGALVELTTSDAGRGWQAVGRVNLGRTGYCTGALIAPNLVLTAAHCLYDKFTGEPVPIDEIEFRAGWRNGRAEAYRRVRRIATHPDYSYDNDTTIDRVGYDVALLELDRPIRNTHITPFATGARPNRGDEVGIVSYATGRDDAPSLEEICEVLSRTRNVLTLSCDVDFGASGAPVFVVEDGEARIVSVVSAKGELGERRIAFGAAVAETLAVVRAELAGSDGVFGRGLPQTHTVAPRAGVPGTETSGGARFVKP
jgi:V8-like Glu-specific endopeptidase